MHLFRGTQKFLMPTICYMLGTTTRIYRKDLFMLPDHDEITILETMKRQFQYIILGHCKELAGHNDAKKQMDT